MPASVAQGQQFGHFFAVDKKTRIHFYKQPRAAQIDDLRGAAVVFALTGAV
jgi:hypothetical protein